MYAYIIEPESTAGVLESRLRNEIVPSVGYTFGSISVPGTAPRCWYYELRSVDPAARRYAAIVIPSDEYHDQEQYPDARDSDLHYVLARLDYQSTEDSLTGEQRQLIEEVVARDRPADTGRGTAYFRYWYGRILDRYTGSGTKIIFLRLPRAPIPPPDYPPKLNSAVRCMGSKNSSGRSSSSKRCSFSTTTSGFEAS
jgi:hypothetical protein